ncbi:hypothetical protein [Pseudomonas sp. ML2-2023-3]|uniref:hypothetical protein n=1 Tax=Pseudomonas sp. ML2-2023-3 TaxID=3122375 RepID=UPI0030CDC935
MKKITKLAMLSALISLVGCSPQETPSSTVEEFISATENENAAEAAKYLTPEAALWLPMMIAAAQEPGRAEIIKEEISADGNSATVYVKNPNGKEQPLQLIRSEDNWKLTITIRMGAAQQPEPKAKNSTTLPFTGKSFFNFYGGTGTQQSITINQSGLARIESYGTSGTFIEYEGPYSNTIKTKSQTLKIDDNQIYLISNGEIEKGCVDEVTACASELYPE